MELLKQISSRDNLNLAFKKVVSNKGVEGVDKVTVEEIFEYIKENKCNILEQIRN